MDITRGSLDDISRPASSERSRAGSRVSRTPDSPGLLIVLSPDIPEGEPREQSGALEEESCSTVHDGSSGLMRGVAADDGGHVLESEESRSPAGLEDLMEGNVTGNLGVSHADGSDEENEGSELQKAVRKMRRLDEILALRISKEKEVKKKGKKLHQKLLEELQELKSKEAAERADETENTRLFLALDCASSHGPTEDEGVAPIFGTQVLHDAEEKNSDEGEKGQRKLPESNRLIQEEATVHPSHSPQRGQDRSKKKQDFVKKNIELAREAGSQVLMTEGEKRRLAEILQDLDDDDADPTNNEEDSSMLAVHRCAGDGYTPEPTEVTRLCHIDSKLKVLLPVESFLSVCSSNLHHTPCQGPGVGCSSGRTGLPGEKVLQDTWEIRGQEARLREIEDQLERLGRDQNLVGTAGRRALPGEQLRMLLEDCMVALSDSSGHWNGKAGVSPQDGPDNPGSPDLLPGSFPRLSSSMLSELLGNTMRGGDASQE